MTIGSHNKGPDLSTTPRPLRRKRAFWWIVFAVVVAGLTAFYVYGEVRSLLIDRYIPVKASALIE